ncbi:YceI family protein [Pseudodesulfovibrio thermohalotolerans]|uniref:YceI family protein n=1 Tax=Pseudodesulfovibrio thermohalotolerans TaxID=2880651 RepID=UPI0024435F04|nr:YceI family protein [Pseudodesulfovibrio thermohalotolerans]WFS63155.1 YceI family protein [Pseudodesulfovibrio thermohalotolerans]
MKQKSLFTIFRIPAALLLVLGLAATAGAETWKVDPDHSAAHFSIRHLTIAQVRGMFPAVSGNIEFDADKPKSIDITIDVDSIDTGVEARDAHLKSSDFFAAKIHPVMTFKSTRVYPVDDGYAVSGVLTIKGASREVNLVVTGLDSPRADPWGNTRLGAAAEFSIDRRDYGVDWNAPLDGGGFMVGNTVHIAVDLEAIKAK